MVKSLTPKQNKYLAALFTTRSQSEACKKAGISLATGKRYRAQNNFKHAYQAVQLDLMEHTGNALRTLTGEAVTTLEHILNDSEASNSDKIRAAKLVLDSAFKVQEQQDILDRISRLERLQAENES